MDAASLHSRPLRVFVAVLALLLGCMLIIGCEPEDRESGVSITTSTDANTKRTTGGISSMTANARVYNSVTMIDSIIIEYDDMIELPETPSDDEPSLYWVEDSRATYGERDIQAIYTNDMPEKRSDQTSVPGHYVVIEFAPVVPDPGSVLYWKIPTDGTRVLVERDGGIRLRGDYTGLLVNQSFVAQTHEGTTVRSEGTLSELTSADVSWPQLADFEIDEVFMGSSGDLHYSYRLPDGYDPQQSYPLVIVLSDAKTNIAFTDKGTVDQGSIGMNLVADTQVVGWTNQTEPVIVLAPQPATNDEMAEKQITELINWFIGAHSVDPERIYATGYAEGAETMARVVADNPNLFAAYLHNTATWPVNGWPLIKNRVAIYLFCSASEETVTQEYLEEVYSQLADAYASEGYSDEQIAQMLWMKLPEDSYFERQGIASPHDGGRLAINDQTIVDWMLSQRKGAIEPENPVEEDEE